MHRLEWPPRRKGKRCVGAGAGSSSMLAGTSSVTHCLRSGPEPRRPHSARSRSWPCSVPGPAARSPRPPWSLDYGPRACGVAASEPGAVSRPGTASRKLVFVLVGLGRIQVCFSDGALPSSFSRNLPSSAPLRRPLPALSKVVTSLGADRMKHTGGTPSHHLKSKV